MDSYRDLQCNSIGQGQGEHLTYVLVTPARNEAAFIGLTLDSMVGQTLKPVKWVIVSDGSTDGTDEIVSRYAAEHEWIEHLRLPERKERHFAAKVNAFNAGYARVADLKYDIIGNLDADISFERDHFEFLLARFAENPSLGVAGTAYIEDSSLKYDYEIVNIEDVSGQCQLFRRECFDEIGGYIPIKDGGIDSVPVYTARMKGWETRTFTGRTFVHHRKVGAAMGTLAAALFRSGKKAYFSGGHPLWELFRSLYNMKNRPYVVRGILLFSGYMWPFLRRAERSISPELIAFRRKEQMQRLKVLFRKLISGGKADSSRDGTPANSGDQ